MIAETSASMCRRLKKSIACKWANDDCVGKGGAHRQFTLPALADVERWRGRVGADSGDLDEPFESMLLRPGGQTARRLDVHGMKRLSSPLDVETDGIDRRV